MMRSVSPFISLVIAVVVFFFYTRPMFADIEALQLQTAEFMNAAEKAQELNRELSEKVTRKRSFDQVSLDRLDALVPPSIDEVKALTDVSELARKHNMLFGNISLQTENTKKRNNEGGSGTLGITLSDLSHTDVQFGLIGTYEQFKAFLGDVEQSLVMLEVIDVNFTAGEGLLQQFDMKVRLYSLPPLES